MDHGIVVIMEAIDKLKLKHAEHMAMYGSGNDVRMTGTNETSSIHEFTSGVGNRAASIRIPIQVAADGKGYLEDRRPSSSMDPYQVSYMLLKTCIE